MAGLVGVPARERAGCPVPAIHVLVKCEAVKTWMPGTRPGMTTDSVCGTQSRYFVSRTCFSLAASQALVMSNSP